MYIYIYQCMLEKISNYIYLLNEAYKLEQKFFRKKNSNYLKRKILNRHLLTHLLIAFEFFLNNVLKSKSLIKFHQLFGLKCSGIRILESLYGKSFHKLICHTTLSYPFLSQLLFFLFLSTFFHPC